jgi:hypothetical protein
MESAGFLISVGLKEWAVVCEALGRGEQSILLRKGGIAEGHDDFAFRFAEFFLFPTFFHQEIEKVRRNGGEMPKAREGEIEIFFFIRLVLLQQITSREVLAALEPLHILAPSVVRERFDYGQETCLEVALVRVFRLLPSWRFPDLPAYGGCRSWVKLPDCPPGTQFEPVLTDQEHGRRVKNFHAATSA